MEEFWRYYWRVNIPADANISWQTCTSTCDSCDRGDTVAECVIDKLCPSSIRLLFCLSEGKRMHRIDTPTAQKINLSEKRIYEW